MQTLEVAVGVIAYFLLMCMIASAIIDLIEARIRKKGRNLLKAVRIACGGGKALASAFYRHPLIDALFEGETAETGVEVEDKGTLAAFFHRGWAPKGLPSYIPDELFARAFLETLLRCKVEEAGDLGALFSPEKRLWRFPDEREQGAEASDAATKPGVEPAFFRQDLDDAYDVVRPMVVESAGDAGRTLEALAVYFKKVNDRAAGWYRRWVTRWLFGVGLVIAVGTNGDTISIVNRLSADPALRRSMLELAEAYSKEPAKDGGETGEKTKREALLKDIEASQAISGGWTKDPLLHLDDGSGRGSFWGRLLLKILGLGLTACAISLGAPFWFHLLQALLKLRGSISGKQQEEPAEPITVEEAKEKVHRLALPSSPKSAERGGASLLDSCDYAAYAEGAYLDATRFGGLAGEKGFTVKFLTQTKEITLEGAKPVKVDTQAYLLDSTDRLVVVFRGTEPKVPADIVTDARFSQIKSDWLPEEADGARVHAGFAAALESVWDEVESAFHFPGGSAKTVVFCGHSLGGALAVLAAARFLAGDPERRRHFGGLYTIGQPRVGNKDFASWAQRQFAGRYVRAVNNRDAVPRLPPLGTSYHHFGTVHYFDASGSLWVDPSWFFRFLDYALPEEAVEGASGPDWVRTLKEAATDHSAGDYASLYKQTAEIAQRV